MPEAPDAERGETLAPLDALHELADQDMLDESELAAVMAAMDMLDCSHRELGDARHCRHDRPCLRCARTALSRPSPAVEETPQGEQARMTGDEIMRLAAISTATLQNTEASVAERIGPGHPYYTVAYGDVCRAVDREMQHRTDRDAAVALLRTIVCEFAGDNQARLAFLRRFDAARPEGGTP